MPAYRTPESRLRDAAERAEHLRTHLTRDLLDALFETIARRTVTKTNWMGGADPNKRLGDEVGAVHAVIHATHVTSCCDALVPGAQHHTRAAAHGPLAMFAVDAPAATDLSDLAPLTGSWTQDEPGDAPDMGAPERSARARQREATLRLLRGAAISAATTGYTATPHLDAFWQAALVLSDPEDGAARQRAVRTLIAAGALADADIEQVLSAAVALTV